MSVIKEIPKKTDRRKLWSYFDKSNTQQLYVLSLCIQLGWSKKHFKSGREVADLAALDSWLRGKSKSGQSPVKKPLNEMITSELSTVISAMENMVKKHHSK